MGSGGGRITKSECPRCGLLDGHRYPCETVPEAFTRKISGDPQFQIAKPSGKAFVIGGAKPPTTRALTPEEQEIITLLETSRGRPLTEQEIYLSLEQARHIGEL
jgi:hypothetical protein